MSIKLVILGYNSAIPTAHSHPTAQWLNINEQHFLIDCGEGTQVQLRKAKAKFSKINQIFISHLHGDHVFGLVGLISTFQLLGRNNPLDIFGPIGIKDFILNQLKHTGAHSTFDLIFHELDNKKSELIFENKKVQVYTLPLEHRVICNGYLFQEKKALRKLNMAAIAQEPEIEVCDYSNLKLGKDFVKSNGEIIANTQLTSAPTPPKSYAFCSDTRYLPQLATLIQNVDCIYHEATFGEEFKELAYKTGHSTAKQAAEIAQQAHAKRMIIGHFSNRYKDLNVLLHEAQSVFPNTQLPHLLEEITI